MMSEMFALWLRKDSAEQPVPTWNILLMAVSGRAAANNIAKEFSYTHISLVLLDVTYKLHF